MSLPSLSASSRELRWPASVLYARQGPLSISSPSSSSTFNSSPFSVLPLYPNATARALLLLLAITPFFCLPPSCPDERGT